MKNQAKVFLLLILLTILLLTGMIYLFYQKIQRQNQILDRMSYMEEYLQGVRSKQYTLREQDVNTVLRELSEITQGDLM